MEAEYNSNLRWSRLKPRSADLTSGSELYEVSLSGMYTLRISWRRRIGSCEHFLIGSQKVCMRRARPGQIQALICLLQHTRWTMSLRDNKSANVWVGTMPEESALRTPLCRFISRMIFLAFFWRIFFNWSKSSHTKIFFFEKMFFCCTTSLLFYRCPCSCSDDNACTARLHQSIAASL